MSSTEDDDVMIKLDANIEVETVVRNRFEEYEDLCYNDPFSNHYSVSSDEEMVETSVESSQTSTEYRDLDNAGSDVSETYTSAVSDVSAESTDSMPVDVAMHEITKEQPETSPPPAAHFLESRLKYVNCKELIVFCIDMSSDMEKVPYIVADESDERGDKNSFSKESGDSSTQQSDEPHSSRVVNQAKHSPLSLIKRAIGMFVHNKHFIDKKHEYALMILQDVATWVCEFTNSPNQLVDALEDLTDTAECNYCDLSSIISLFYERITMWGRYSTNSYFPKLRRSEKYPFILSNEFQPLDVHRLIRVILIYGRANCEIVFSDPNAREILMENPSLFLDIVYVHEPPSEENKCVEIYDELCSLDDKDKSYIFETTRSVTSLHNAMGRLLAHPYQRAAQKNANYRLQDIVPQEQQRQS